MLFPFKFSISEIERKRAISPFNISSKKAKYSGTLFEMFANSFKVEEAKPLTLKEFISNLHSPDIAVNIETLDRLRTLFKRHFDSGFVSRNQFMNEIIHVCVDKNIEDLHLSAVKLIGEVLKHSKKSQHTNVSIPYLVLLLDPAKPKLLREAIPVLRNIEFATLSAHIFISTPGISLLLGQINEQIEPDMLKDITCILMKVVKANPPLTNNQIRSLLQISEILLFHPNDEVLGNVCCLLDYLTRSLHAPFNQITQTNIIASIVEKFNKSNLRVLMNALNVISNFIFYGEADQARFVFEYDVLTAIPGLFKHELLRIKTLEVVAVLLCGSINEFKKVLDSNVPESLLELLKLPDSKICNQSIRCFIKIVERGTWFQKKSVLDKGLIKALGCVLLSSSCDNLLAITLITIGFYVDSAGVDLKTTEDILKQAQEFQFRLDALKELSIEMELRTQAILLDSKLKSALFLASS